ncbi:hypothetical protein [Amycolatopsis dendrobii]|uniref:Terminase small subunit n=1 Tax=Amycolatopsis dendrobii TaxID=2760662 RepID=A0A7W3ZAL3_9PSEU|nr:hypothetical protein [Amycolatopsis dendrobii]MBB1153987.1 hypothetical protein [Amycolatopsis dendrobii]
MTKGGARNRSGPQKDPGSGRSDRLGVKLTALPAEGHRGEVPEYPLAKLRIYYEYFEDGQKVRELDPGAMDARWEREIELWEWAWATPQACAWARERWRWHAIAMWVRTSALCESADATAADKNSLHRFADQIGLTPAGLRENGWAISADEVAGKRGERAAEPEPEDEAEDPRTRLTVVSHGRGA